MSSTPRIAESVLATRLRREIEGEVLFDSFSRGRYATDASIYQIEPVGVVVARSVNDIQLATAIAAEEGVSVLPRGAGTSQCGQTVGDALVIDTSKHLNNIISSDPEQQRVRVQPGIVLDQLNAQLRHTGLHFPVDVSPANRATIGGMTGNNSCGSRSIRYGNMVHNVEAVRTLLADGTVAEFGPVPGNFTGEGYAHAALRGPGATHARSAHPRCRRDCATIPQAAAPSRWLQHRQHRSGWPQHVALAWWALKARSAFSPRLSSSSPRLPRHAYPRDLSISRNVLSSHGCHPAHRQTRPERRSNWSIAR